MGGERIVFVTVPLAGHKRVAASLAAEMARRGYSVEILVSAAGATEDLLALEQHNDSRTSGTLRVISFEEGSDLTASMDWTAVAASSGGKMGSVLSLMKAFAAITEDLSGCLLVWQQMVQHLQQGEPPAVVVLDHSMKLVQMWATEQEIPTVILHTSYFDARLPPEATFLQSSTKVAWTAILNAAIGIRNMFSLRSGQQVAADGPLERLQALQPLMGLKSSGPIHFGEGAAGAPKAMGCSPHTLVFCEPEFLNAASVPERVHVVGPCFAASSNAGPDAHLSPWLEDALRMQQRVVYVALGTLGNGFLSAESVGIMLDAFGDLLSAGWRVLWSLPRAQQSLLQDAVALEDSAGLTLPRLFDNPQSFDGFEASKSRDEIVDLSSKKPVHPGGRATLSRTHVLQDPRFKVESFVRQREILSHSAVAVFMTHGGQSSVNESLVAGVPLVCMPLFCDQFDVAESLMNHRLGLVYDKEALRSSTASAATEASHRLADVLRRAATDTELRQNVDRVAALMRSRGDDCRRGAEVLEAIALAGPEYEELWNKGSTPRRACLF
eukprot:TRINITY_DN22351_c0_g1_i1.p1 TRINITY_DN22351_c0_g1~~TRINITY_DN22351_c0_g1_i1.p1  ORF type:complete len:553 (+),score=95.94 TRINITY_DN22351_c0_g1_i1:353-2011(+)